MFQTIHNPIDRPELPDPALAKLVVDANGGVGYTVIHSKRTTTVRYGTQSDNTLMAN